ncbi:MAG: hypothetical protein U0359_31040 [Byssovorax sp.]
MGASSAVSAAVSSLGVSGEVAVVDGLADPGGLIQALGRDAIVLRAFALLGKGEATFGPLPAPLFWVSLRRGEAAARKVALDGGPMSEGKVERVVLDHADEDCCDAPSCALHRRRGSVVLEFAASGGEVERLLVTEQRAPEGTKLSAARAVGERLADFLGVPLDAPAADSGEEGALPEPIAPQLGAVELARFALRSESDRYVLRDHRSRGPKESAGRNTVVGALLLLVAAAAGFEGFSAYTAHEQGKSIAGGALFALFALAGYAFLGVARFSSRYGATSSPLCAIGRDKLVILPWVSRDGAIDLRPEGRFGAAIPLGEVRAPSVKSRGDLFGVEMDTDHGPIDAMITEHESVARYWAEVLTRHANEVRHPQAGASARQRARQRAREEMAQAKS